MRSLFCVLVWATSLAAGEWRFVAPYGGSATAVAVDPQHPKRVLAGTHSSLLFLSEDGASHWKPLPFPRHFLGDLRVVRFDPLNSHRLLVGVQISSSANAGLYESRDDGQHWQQMPALRGLSVEALTIWRSDPHRMIAGTRDGAYLTTDGGSTWKRVTPASFAELRAITSVAIDPEHADVIYAGTPHLPWKSVDGGANWQPMHTGIIDDSDVMSIAVDSRSTQRLYASACSGIYHSESQGLRWSKYGGLSDGQRRTHVILQDPQMPQLLYAGTTAGLLRSLDGGGTWRQVNQFEINGMAVDPAEPSTVYLATERAGIVKSTDRGVTFMDANEGFSNRGVLSVAASDTGVFVLTKPNELGQSLYVCGGDGNCRPLAASPVRSGVGAALAVSGKTMLYAEEESVQRSTDGGRSWQTVVPSRSEPGRTQILAMHAVEGAFLISTPTTIRRSTDGVNWTAVQTMRPVNRVKAFFGPVGSPHIAALTPIGATLSEDGGRRWRNVLLPLNAGAANALAYSDDGRTVLLATNKGLFRSVDAGQAWNRSEEGLPGGSVSGVTFIPGRQGQALALSFGAVYRSRDGGLTWKLEAHSANPAARVLEIVTQDRERPRLFALTADTGLSLLQIEP